MIEIMTVPVIRDKKPALVVEFHIPHELRARRLILMYLSMDDRLVLPEISLEKTS
jgi:hypothetical protein